MAHDSKCYEDANDEESTAPHQKQKEELVVLGPYAVDDPHTVVIHSEDAPLTCRHRAFSLSERREAHVALSRVWRC